MIYVVGDIHGCYNALRTLMAELPLEPSDELVFLGDYIDRGPRSRQVVEYLLAERRPGWHFLRGNHEQLLLDWLEGVRPEAEGAWLINGGYQTLQSYVPREELDEVHGRRGHEALKRFIPPEHVEFFKSLPFFRDTKEAFFCHAGVNLAKPLNRQSPDDLLWIRGGFFDDLRPAPKLIVHGHTPVNAVDTTGDRINMDTGCVYGGVLSAMSLPDRRVYEAREP